MWDLSSLTRDWTCAPYIEKWCLNPWTIREVPRLYFFKVVLSIPKNWAESFHMPLIFPNSHASPYCQHLCRPNFGQKFFSISSLCTFSWVFKLSKPCLLMYTTGAAVVPVLLGVLVAISQVIREGNGTPLQYSCLGNPMDGGACSRLQSMVLLGVGHDWATSFSLFTFMHWRRKRQPIPVLLPGESQGWGSLVGCHLWGRTESDTTEAT